MTDCFPQNLIFSVNKNQGDIEQLTGDSSDLMGTSVDSRISVNMQQITSRFKAMQQTAKVKTISCICEGIRATVIICGLVVLTSHLRCSILNIF